MQYEEITLNHLFRHKDFHEEKVSEIEFQEKITELREKVIKKEPKLKWKNVLDEVMSTSSQLLDISLKDVLDGAWKKYKEVEKYLNEELYNNNETFLIPLLKHTVVSEHFPKIEIRIGETYIGKIDFEVQLKLILTGIILKISKGEIQGVKAGTCKSKGTFLCEGITLFQDESSEFEF